MIKQSPEDAFCYTNSNYNGVTSPRLRESRMASQLDGETIFNSMVAEFGKPVPYALLDLYDIAQEVFKKDRATPRSNKWNRDFHVNIGVRDIELWRRRDVQDALHAMLRFSMGDRWAVNFVHRNLDDYSFNTYLDFPELRESFTVALTSEGMDSGCGIRYFIKQGTGKTLLCLNAVSQEERSYLFSEQLKNTELSTRRWLRVLKLPIRQQTPELVEEPSQRSRSLMLLTLSVLAAQQSDASDVLVFENGLEAFNFPLLHGSDGERYSRIMHPIVLARMQKLVDLLPIQPIQFQMPFLLSTKAHMLRVASKSTSEAWIDEAISCHHFSARTGKKQCGVCMGCLLRRVALKFNEMDDASQYRVCIFSEKEASEKDTSKLDLLNAGVSRLQLDWQSANNDEQRWEELMKLSGLYEEQAELVKATATLSRVTEEEAQKGIVSLYKKFIHEWNTVQPSITLLPTNSVQGNTNGK